MKLVLQRGLGDCGIAAVATILESSYEDVFVEAAKVDKDRRGRSGIHLARLVTLGKKLGVAFHLKRPWNLDTDEGLLVVRWLRRRKDRLHLVVLAHGVIVDPADGQILPHDEYFVRANAAPDAFLELL